MDSNNYLNKMTRYTLKYFQLSPIYFTHLSDIWRIIKILHKHTYSVHVKLSEIGNSEVCIVIFRGESFLINKPSSKKHAKVRKKDLRSAVNTVREVNVHVPCIDNWSCCFTRLFQVLCTMDRFAGIRKMRSLLDQSIYVRVSLPFAWISYVQDAITMRETRTRHNNGLTGLVWLYCFPITIVRFRYYVYDSLDRSSPEQFCNFRQSVRENWSDNRHCCPTCCL